MRNETGERTEYRMVYSNGTEPRARRAIVHKNKRCGANVLVYNAREGERRVRKRRGQWGSAERKCAAKRGAYVTRANYNGTGVNAPNARWGNNLEETTNANGKKVRYGGGAVRN